MSRKPDTKTAMYQLLNVIRKHIPFGLKEADMCQGICRGCSKKMMEMLDAEVSQWQADLDNELAEPTLADLVFMEKLARRTEKVLHRNKLMN
ncbi:UNVERIFIED_ORG: hypothetical protein DFO82_2079 [Idiomarina abyssalis]|jgi:hypothetical protein|uniref:hypothetical protein n=1 Tax=unclassified Idiomarina TaxID=2614829 RepID=UPI000C66240B|nr:MULTISPECIES: hypothetical protein [unclassified Idiomarina]MAA61478.1 hypothetical protein [Idiomarina sp.]TDO48089.1 hypothetical protein DEU30_10724 [Idiomarina sp. 017G]|tara:strand:- start:4015 stop:4290 length:276 start_codon:yes stop_codon:yes gene_type:complete